MINMAVILREQPSEQDSSQFVVESGGIWDGQPHLDRSELVPDWVRRVVFGQDGGRVFLKYSHVSRFPSGYENERIEYLRHFLKREPERCFEFSVNRTAQALDLARALAQKILEK